MIVVVGEALVDVVVDPDGSSTESVGGSPLNVAVGLGRLGSEAVLLTAVGDDERGRRVVEHVTGSGARILASTSATGRTSVATATVDPAGIASYDFDLEWDLPRQELPVGQALHVGSLGTVLEPGRGSVVDLTEQARARDLFVSYDVNLRDSFVQDAVGTYRDVRALGARCTLVKLSDEDAELLDPAVDPDEVARTLLDGQRTDLVILTRGASGATAFTSGATADARPRPVEVVDTVGAGDAFMAAVLAQLDELGAFDRPDRLPRDRAALERLLRGAVEVAAITCERRGADPPRRQELPPSWPS